MSVGANGQGPREKSRTPKAKANADAPATPLPLALTPASSTPVVHEADTVMDDSSKGVLDGMTATKYAHLFLSHYPIIVSFSFL